MPRDQQVYVLQGNATSTAVVLPKQERHFRLLAIACTLEGGAGGANTRVLQLRASFGGVAPFLRIGTGEIGQTITGGACWACGLAFSSVTFNGGASYQFAMSLPDLVLEPNTVVELAWDNGGGDDVIGNPTFVIERL